MALITPFLCRVNLLLCALVWLSACAVQGNASSVPTASPVQAAATTVPTVAVTATSVQQATYTNPVLNQDFPDPDTLKVGDTYYAYATNSGSMNIQAAKSPDLVHWTILPSALPALPKWARSGFTWAPEVTTAANNGYVMYFVARDMASDKQCIGVATSAKPEGPFKSTGEKPLICQLDQGGSIDPSSFADDNGTHYLLWKNDGNCCRKDTWLYLQQISGDGLQLQGTPARLIKQDQGWEGNLVEAPTLWKHNNKYYLFYSANDYAGLPYAVGYATADTIGGPYRKPAKPILPSSIPNHIVGPGGQDIVTAKDGSTWIMYHAWNKSVRYRSLRIDPLVWQGDVPTVQGTNGVPEPMP